MSRRAGATNAGQEETTVKPKDNNQEKQAMLLAQDVGHFSLVRALHMADLITEMNGFCGFMSILSSLRYCLSDPQDLTNLWFAFGFMPLGLFFDFFDGKVARWREKSSLMGQELDSLADLVSFGVAPAALGFVLGFRTNIDQLFLTYYVLCGLTRLARFNVTVAMLPKDKTGKSQYFEGTPIPFGCLTTAAVMAYWTSMGWIHHSLPFGTVLTGTPFEFHLASFMWLLSGSLMISKTLHIPKP
ncbi:CDP-diacylglycerol-serine O-phosphatidyltransferase [Elasticomyces elasticus]|uniref:CDP-diacylglycerol--serine O-phosphatidyltransferase n=1 Tax=Exophiala sideris TaxID=1016849 RepID=A0ABR0JCC9_9EURO|nr:CDP-diacylglycerol-serine O-phosphatidyltransferase [Elasticomyces elasticus]KAK5031250.1 CDP-diacylglycerol-serine O-phosphatidyltransferase [Exophiala sideris]KAK5038970.1 CDP-diacylglycerol-serine O-phosphatidyltransferase [Exophiala sideris]KAK5060855.1 CDP-diacylglycerol-serine O-phosphatidyltransferase [Exophiala sideris]KAK5183766.1 CDP-diacylglycerol-serine O-phosphatidyltransferase [Eurotiomycetes sp. CCFEE 6388]